MKSLGIPEGNARKATERGSSKTIVANSTQNRWHPFQPPATLMYWRNKFEENRAQAQQNQTEEKQKKKAKTAQSW